MSDVRFVRINGRIVPIKSKSSKTQSVSGKLAVGAVGVAAVAEKSRRSLEKHAANIMKNRWDDVRSAKMKKALKTDDLTAMGEAIALPLEKFAKGAALKKKALTASKIRNAGLAIAGIAGATYAISKLMKKK